MKAQFAGCIWRARAFATVRGMSGTKLILTDAHAEGTPKSGIEIHRAVTNTSARFALMSGGVQWIASGAGFTATVAATIASVKGQCFYIAHQSFEPRVPSDAPATVAADVSSQILSAQVFKKDHRPDSLRLLLDKGRAVSESTMTEASTPKAV